MKVNVYKTKQEMGAQAARDGASVVHSAISARGNANIIVATGASQFEVLDQLTQVPGIDWSCVTIFHLDEYIGLPITHPASFRRYLRERFVDLLPSSPRGFLELNGEGDCAAECDRIGSLLKSHPIDVAFVGIGENGHLAFNDPPADFAADDPYLIVELDEKCRRQQLGERWFESLDVVPTHAISMSVRQILKSNVIVCTVPDERKAAAVQAAVEGEITPLVPASILQRHNHVTLYLDEPAATLLGGHSNAD